MKKVWHSVVAPLRIITRMMRIYRFTGGADALEQRLTELEEEMRSSSTIFHCPGCGSTDVEPTAFESNAKGERVAKFRCKACGWETSC